MSLRLIIVVQYVCTNLHIKLRRSALIRVRTARYGHEPTGATPPSQISFLNNVASWMPRGLTKKTTNRPTGLNTFIEIYVKRCNAKVLWFENLSNSDVERTIFYIKNPSLWAIRKADRSKRRSVVLVVPYICWSKTHTLQISNKKKPR